MALMGTKSRDRLYGSSVRMAAERAAEARKESDRLACEAWTKRMLAFKGPAQPSPTLGDALNAGHTYLAQLEQLTASFRVSTGSGLSRIKGLGWAEG
jgi:hypothetical protein